MKNSDKLPYILFHFLKEMCFIDCPCGNMNIDKKKDISVLIPCYGKSESIERAVLSAVRQTVPTFQILVLLMDEKSAARKEKLQRIGGVVKCVVSDRLNASAARNKLVELCANEFFVFLDADDELAENYLEEAFKAESSLAFAPYEINGVKKSFPSNDKNWFINGNFTCLFNKTTFNELGGFDERLGFGGEDVDLIMRLLLQGKWNVSMTNATCFKYDNSGGLSKTEEFYKSTLAALNKWLPIFKEKYPFDCPCIHEGVCKFLDKIGDTISVEELNDFFSAETSCSINKIKWTEAETLARRYLAVGNKPKIETKFKVCQSF